MADQHTMMNEILPTPEGPVRNSPRDRVRSSLQRLVAISALATACDAHTGVTETPKDPPKDPTPPTDPQDGMMRSGYAVVDPMPPPARCKAASSLPIHASWDQHNGEKLLKIEVGPLATGFSWVTTKPAQLQDANSYLSLPLVDQKEGAKRTFWVRSSTAQVVAYLPITCDAGPGQVSVRVLGTSLESTAQDVPGY